MLKPGAMLVLTTNLKGHWKEFYNIFESGLARSGRYDLVALLKKDEDHRGTLDSVTSLFTQNKFRITKIHEESFRMNFNNGTAFLNHHFIKLGWLTTWLSVFPKEDHAAIFAALEKDLNGHAEKSSGLSLTVPMAYIEGEKTM